MSRVGGFTALLAGLALLLAESACTSPTPSPPAPSAGPKAGAGLGIYKVGKPYQVDGIWYYPHEDWSYDETGIASWYGEAFHGKYTANGEVFDLNQLTAAHHTLPIPCVVQVTNLDNGRSIELRVNDRGPFAHGRIIDVSRRAAHLLGFEQQGTAKVRVRLLATESMQVAAVARHNGTDEDLRLKPVEIAQAVPRTEIDTQALAPLPGTKLAPPPARTTGPEPMQTAAADPLATPLADPPLPEKVTLVGAKPNTQIYVQAGAFAQIANANRVVGRIAALGSATIVSVRVNGADLYRVRLGPIATVDQADELLAKVVATGYLDAKIVVD